VETHHRIPDTLDELQVLERQVEREWWWLHGAISAVAQLQAERSVGDVKSFREMQVQARAVDRRRLQIAIRIAELLHGLTPGERYRFARTRLGARE
jgi:hypothetical protein